MKSQKNQKSAPRPFQVELLSRRWLSHITFEIGLTRPPSFEFHSGQSLRINDQQLERDYSLLSSSMNLIDELRHQMYELISFLIFLGHWNNEQITDELHHPIVAILTRFTQGKENFPGYGFLIKPV